MVVMAPSPVSPSPEGKGEINLRGLRPLQLPLILLGGLTSLELLLTIFGEMSLLNSPSMMFGGLAFNKGVFMPLAFGSILGAKTPA
jgi:hypothetical protein